MASGYGSGAPADRYHGGPPPPPSLDVGYPDDRNWQQGGHHTPDRSMASPTLSPKPNANNQPGPPARDWNTEDRQVANRTHPPRQRSTRSASVQVRICEKCGLQLTGQFVRALEGTYHLDCFKCRVCGLLETYFPLTGKSPPFPLFSPLLPPLSRSRSATRSPLSLIRIGLHVI
jgi:hypothetical protein